MPFIRWFYRFLLACLMVSGLGISSANAALVTQISNLDIGGTLYDVTFHSGSYQSIWDPDLNGVFDDGIIKRRPTFLDDAAGAQAAANALLSELGTEDSLIDGAFVSDRFLIPYELFIHPNPILSRVSVLLDGSIDLSNDFIQATGYAPSITARQQVAGMYADFSQVSAVPLPGAMWLFGTALIGLLGFNRRKASTTV